MDFKHRKNERGVTLLEFALTLPVFLVIVIGTVELLRISYHSLSLQFAASEAARKLSISPPTNLGQIETMVEQRLTALGIKFDTRNSSDRVVYCPAKSYKTPSCPSFLPGEQHEAMVLEVRKDLKRIILPTTLLPIYRLQGLVVVRNEPWNQ